MKTFLTLALLIVSHYVSALGYTTFAEELLGESKDIFTTRMESTGYTKTSDKVDSQVWKVNENVSLIGLFEDGYTTSITFYFQNWSYGSVMNLALEEGWVFWADGALENSQMFKNDKLYPMFLVLVQHEIGRIEMTFSNLR